MFKRALLISYNKAVVLAVLVIFFANITKTVHARSQQTSIQVYNSKQLYAALEQANKYGKTRIELHDGEYETHNTLIIKQDYITLKSVSGNRDKVIISGRGMKKTRQVNNLIHVSAQHFTLDGITLQQAGNHLIQIAGEYNADFPTLRNCTLRNSYEQLLKVSYNSKTKVASDNGIVESCEFIYTAGIGPQYYIGGIDVHAGHNWIIRKNVFQNIASPDKKIAEHAIHFWSGTHNILVEDNIIINCDRGIGFGLGNRSNQGGTIQNNLILHSSNHHHNASVGIILESSPNTKILNNRIYLAHNYQNAIEYRFPSTVNVVIAGNLTNKAIRTRNGASAKLSNNTESKNLEDFLTTKQLASFTSLLKGLY